MTKRFSGNVQMNRISSLGLPYLVIEHQNLCRKCILWVSVTSHSEVTSAVWPCPAGQSGPVHYVRTCQTRRTPTAPRDFSAPASVCRASGSASAHKRLLMNLTSQRDSCLHRFVVDFLLKFCVLCLFLFFRGASVSFCIWRLKSAVGALRSVWTKLQSE